jgi:YfiH family protein
VTADWIVPDWPAPTGVRAVSTLRTGGVSGGVYASWNLGDHVGDEPAAVARNRERLLREADLPSMPRWLRQVHGVAVADLDTRGTDPGLAAIPVPTADGAFSRQPGTVCAVLTADCVPVLFAAEDGSVVGAAHAGWRGLAAGVVNATLAALGVAPQRVLAWIGPCIGPLHFEVGPEVREALLPTSPGADAAFERNGRGHFLADLPWLVRRQLVSLGVSRVSGGGFCTYADPARFFSHRRDGQTGRQATLIWREPPPGG